VSTPALSVRKSETGSESPTSSGIPINDRYSPDFRRPKCSGSPARYPPVTVADPLGRTSSHPSVPSAGGDGSVARATREGDLILALSGRTLSRADWGWVRESDGVAGWGRESWARRKGGSAAHSIKATTVSPLRRRSLRLLRVFSLLVSGRRPRDGPGKGPNLRVRARAVSA